jgi:hypothetical protein
MCHTAQTSLGFKDNFSWLERCHAPARTPIGKVGGQKHHPFFLSDRNRSRMSSMKDIDHWKIARQFITTYDECAEKEAATMAGKMLRQGNTGGFNTWKQIATAISDLERRSQTPANPCISGGDDAGIHRY